jgi:hypothetical protein
VSNSLTLEKAIVKHSAIFVAIAIGMAVSAFGASLPINTDAIQKSVVFLYYTRPGGDPEVGTGFLVEIPLKGGKQAHWVLLTARHVVDPEWAGCPWHNPRSITLRMNTSDYKSGDDRSGIWEESIPLVPNDSWLHHTNDDVDAALIGIGNPDEIKAHTDAVPIRIADFGKQQEIEQFKIGVGDGIISAGLVPELLDVKRNYPAFKFGKISNVMTEPVKLRCGEGTAPRNMLNWILAGNFVGGNSGSPVFLLPLEFTVSGGLTYNGPRPMVLGLLSGSINNADLGEMVPVELVFDIIARTYPDSDLFRGAEKDRPKPEGVPAK